MGNQSYFYWNIGKRAVIFIGFCISNGIYNTHAINNFAKDSIFTIKMGCAPLGGIYSTLLFGKTKSRSPIVFLLYQQIKGIEQMMKAGSVFFCIGRKEAVFQPDVFWIFHELDKNLLFAQRCIFFFNSI